MQLYAVCTARWEGGGGGGGVYNEEFEVEVRKKRGSLAE